MAELRRCGLPDHFCTQKTPSKALDCIQILVIRLKLRGSVKTLTTQCDVSIVLDVDSLTSEQKSRSQYVVFLGTAFLDSLVKRENSGAES